MRKRAVYWQNPLVLEAQVRSLRSELKQTKADLERYRAANKRLLKRRDVGFHDEILRAVDGSPKSAAQVSRAVEEIYGRDMTRQVYRALSRLVNEGAIMKADGLYRRTGTKR